MRLLRGLELGSGIITGVVGSALSIYVMKPAESPVDYLRVFSIGMCAALLVAVGAYAQTVSRNSWGRILVWVAGSILVYNSVSMLVHVPIGLYFLGWLGVFLVLPGATAIVTMIAALLTGTTTKSEHQLDRA